MKYSSISDIVTTGIEQYGKLTALNIDGIEYSYQKLFVSAVSLANNINLRDDKVNNIGILTEKSFAGYVSILASLMVGRPYVPINIKFPIKRQIDIIKIAGCSILLYDEYTQNICSKIVESLGSEIVAMTAARQSGTDAYLNQVHKEVISPLAYIMFTSGTTGQPKGIAIRRSNLEAYLRGVSNIVPMSAGTRCTQMFDFSFDLSVHDMLHSWASGGCLYVAGPKEALDPVGFARRNKLESWFSVPSVVASAGRQKRLLPDSLPDLRFSLFCGEPLPISIVKRWASAAPNAQIVNLYGPTEATIAITAHVYDRTSTSYSNLSTIPLGEPLEGSEVRIVSVDDNNSNLGEIYLGGLQISDGYINAPQLTLSKFVKKKFTDSKIIRWFKTGDIVEIDDAGRMIFKHRVDTQIKINGYRIELLEIEEVIRQFAQCLEVAAVPWPINEDGNVKGIVGVVVGSTRAAIDILKGCRTLLPSYMTPRRIVFVERIPTTNNGKVDRRALQEMLFRLTSNNTG